MTADVTAGSIPTRAGRGRPGRMADALMPAAFLGHGNPMNALDDNRYTQAWRAFGASVPRPRAILVVSAHWYINATAVTAMARPRTIHDFYGFPEELFAVEYPAPGAPSLPRRSASRAADLGRPRPRQLGHRPRHLVGARPRVPGRRHPGAAALHQRDKPFDHHLDLGARLAPLRDRGVLIVGSGNVVHNLGGIDGRSPTPGSTGRAASTTTAGAHDDDPAEVAALAATATSASPRRRPTTSSRCSTSPGWPPRPRGADVLVDGYAYGSLSMTSYTLGLPAPSAAAATGARPRPPARGRAAGRLQPLRRPAPG